jgi:hypothetical protein
MKRFPYISLLLLLAAPVCLHAQAMTEYGLSLGRSSLGGAAGAKKVGDATGTALSRTGQAVQSVTAPAQPSAPATPAKAQPSVMRVETARSAGQAGTAPVPAVAPVPTPSAPPKPVDLGLITPGLDRQDLLAKAGKPSMKMTSTEGGDDVEKYWYRTTGGNAVVTLRNGKVASVSPPAVR